MLWQNHVWIGGMLAVVVAVDPPVLADENPRAKVRNVLGHSPADGDRRRYYLCICRPRRRCGRWSPSPISARAIEQQYPELKDESGLDHFEGRTLPGWQRHVVLTAIAYSFLQNERRRRTQPT